jgi:hypothetical protein
MKSSVRNWLALLGGHIFAAVRTIPKHGAGICDMSESVRASASRSVVADPSAESGTTKANHNVSSTTVAGAMSMMAFERSRIFYLTHCSPAKSPRGVSDQRKRCKEYRVAGAE